MTTEIVNVELSPRWSSPDAAEQAERARGRYIVDVRCDNCHYLQLASIPLGTIVLAAIAGKKCVRCQCEPLRPTAKGPVTEP